MSGKPFVSRQGFSVHVTFDVDGAESREEARARIMDALPKMEGVKVSNVHVGAYTITSLADEYKDAL